MSKSLEEKCSSTYIAIVTGAASGIGLATALELSERSMTVIAIDRNDNAFRKLAQRQPAIPTPST
jgi:NADP-dependent 3-hydroxy acid dehydrogenase YdfG